MKTYEQFSGKLAPYRGVEHIYDPLVGNIAWRAATGGNLEVLFFEAAERGKGHGKELYRRMVQRIIATETVPFHSAIGFRLASNVAAERFYAKLGFQQVDLGQSVYRDDGTVIMWITWEGLVRVLGVDA